MNRPPTAFGEAKRTVALAFPIMAGFLGQMLLGLTDTLMIGRVGVTPLAASAFANTLVHVLLIAGIGLLAAVAVLVSHAHGAGKHAEAGEALRHGLLTAAIYGALGTLLLFALFPFLRFFGQPAEVVAAARPYLDIIALSLLFSLLTICLKNYTEAKASPWPAFWILGGAILLNVFLNWVFIFGNLGSPALGLTGAGIATFLARAAGLAGMIWLVFADARFRESLPVRWFAAVDREVTARLLRIGFPVSLQLLMEVGAFSMATLAAGWIGVTALAAHQIALTCAGTTFMFPLGISQAVTIRIGHAMGRGHADRVARIGFGAVGMGVLIMAGFALCFLFFGEMIAAGFTADPEVRRLAATLLIVAGIFQLFDGTQVVSIGALRGLHDVRVPTAVVFIAYWIIALPLGWLIAFPLDLGAVGIWSGLALGLAAAATGLSARFSRLARREVRKIAPDPDLVEPVAAQP